MYWVNLKRSVFDCLEVFLITPFLKLIQVVLQYIFNLIYGPKETDLKGNKALCYDIKINFRFYHLGGNNVNFFLKKYRGTVDVSVIDEENVILYDYNPQEFIYTRIRKGMEHRNATKYPIVFQLNTHNKAVQVIIVRQNVAKEWLRRRKLTDGSNICILHSIGRCGSTLFANILSQTEQFHVYSEPFPLTRLGFTLGQESGTTPMDSPENLDLIRTVFLLLCKREDERYFIKSPVVFTGHLINLIHKALPQVKELFLHRALTNVLPSFQKLLGTLRIYGLTRIAFDLIPMKYRNIWKKIEAETDSVYKRAAFLILVQMHPYYLECQAGRTMRAYSFESIVRNKEAFCRDLFSYLDINQKLLPQALSAFSIDSQEGLPLSKKILGQYPKVVLSDEERRWVRPVAQNLFGIELRQEDLLATNFPQSYTFGN